MSKQEIISIMAAIIFAAQNQGNRPEGSEYFASITDAGMIAEDIYNEVSKEVEPD
jgi:hypothetical protein